jgi:hypothetical protein
MGNWWKDAGFSFGVHWGLGLLLAYVIDGLGKKED